MRGEKKERESVCLSAVGEREREERVRRKRKGEGELEKKGGVCVSGV